MAYEVGGQRKHFWLFMLLLALGVLVIPLGLDALGGAMSADEVNTYVYEMIATLSLITLCVLVLVVFYIINTVIMYKTRRGWPKDYWSAWGITKKVAGVIGVIFCIVFFAITLSNVICDVNDEPVYTTITIGDQTSAPIDNKISVEYYAEGVEEAQYKANLYIKQGVSVAAGKTYKVRVFERNDFWVAVEAVSAK